MLDYVVKLTTDATRCSREDHERLRAVGFDDRGILQITLIACWFNYINRVADALGVGRDWGTEQLIRQPQGVAVASAEFKANL
jgi:uncharacterized protein YciW